MITLPQFVSTPQCHLPGQCQRIPSFVAAESADNIHWDTVAAFGDEWLRYPEMDDREIEQIARDYFDLVPESVLSPSTVALDVGCGMGRWMKFLAPKVGHIDGIDPSDAISAAAITLRQHTNIRLAHADVSTIPFELGKYDFVYSLGVLHHLPNPGEALRQCVRYLRPGGTFLLYLYYNLENRGRFYRALFNLSSVLRGAISRMPFRARNAVTDMIGGAVYFPLARSALLLSCLGLRGSSIDRVPLAYYRNKSFTTMRNDARDRFGTPLEHRFSRAELQSMMEAAGLESVRFSDNPPFWHAVGVRGAK